MKGISGDKKKEVFGVSLKCLVYVLNFAVKVSLIPEFKFLYLKKKIRNPFRVVLN